MTTRVQELCRKLKPVLGRKVDGLWHAYLAESDADGKADIDQTLELLAAKHLGQSYESDRSPFPPPLPVNTGDQGYRAERAIPELKPLIQPHHQDLSDTCPRARKK